MNEIIRNYAHDYRDMKISEDELEKLLNSFISEVRSYQSKKHKKYPLEKIYVNEHLTKDGSKWTLSFEKPEFQGGESITIDKNTADEIQRIKFYEN